MQGRRVKLGPRPSLDAHKRPVTAENFRPVAALPAGFKFFKGAKKGKSQDQDSSEQVDYVTQTNMLAPGILSLSTNDPLPPRPNTSSGASIKSTATSTAPTREGKMTPEKARLMKAMKLREKKLQGAKVDLLNLSKTKPAESIVEVAPDTDIGKLASTKPEAHARDTALDSHPSSPGAASSTGIGDSTKASSLSDLTDETIQASKELEQDGNREGKAAEAGFSDMQKKNSTGQAITSRHETTAYNVSNDHFTSDAEEFVQIPGSEINISQSTAAMIRRSMEPNEFAPHVDLRETSHDGQHLEEVRAREAPADTREIGPATDKSKSIAQVDEQSGAGLSAKEVPSPTASLLPTTPNLKSKFSRKDVTVPIGPAPSTLEKPTATTVANDSSPKQDLPLRNRPEISLVSPPNPVRPKASVEPICTDLSAKSASTSEPSDPLDDDALMDELQTATVQEAKSMLVSKSPITPVFPTPSSPTRKDARLPRAASNPMRGSLLMPVDMSQGNAPRSISSGGAAYLSSLTRNPSNASLQSKKGNVGSSISQRIKALEALSSNPGEDRPRPATPSSTFFTVRKQSTREPSKSPSVVDRASSLTRQPPTPERSREPTPEAAPSTKRERSGSIANKLNMFEGQNAPRGRPESIQVTARIMRRAGSPFANLSTKKPGEAAPAELRHSTLLVDIHRAQSVTPQPLSERPPVVERPKTSVSEFHEPNPTPEVDDKQARRRSSMSLMKNFIKEHAPLGNKSTEHLVATSPATTTPRSPTQQPSTQQSSPSFVRRLSTSSRRSSFNQEGDNASMSAVTTRSSSRVSDSGSADDDKSLSDKKSKNRTSRFMRRLSNSFGGARKSGSASISPTVKEEEVDQLEKAPMIVSQQVSSPTIVAFLGDVNVQFPDNLLWKRRSMCLDAQGFIFLSTVQGGATKGKDIAGTKRFHLGDFRRPYIPDVEIQELPNSVVLDFVEGSSLQIACGDRAGQQNVLRSMYPLIIPPFPCVCD